MGSIRIGRMKKIDRDIRYRNKLKFLEENRSGHPAPVIYTDESYGDYKIAFINGEYAIWNTIFHNYYRLDNGTVATFCSAHEAEDYLVDISVKNPKPYYKRRYRGYGRHSCSNYHKRMSNRKIRHYRGELPRNGYICHRLYDFWWQMY